MYTMNILKTGMQKLELEHYKSCCLKGCMSQESVQKSLESSYLNSVVRYTWNIIFLNGNIPVAFQTNFEVH